MNNEPKLNPEKDNITASDALTWWEQHKNKVFATVILIIGALGGNTDRIFQALPDVYGVVALKKQVNDIDGRVKVLETKPVINTTSDGDIKVEKPIKKLIEALSQ